jgi:hypothetical protein
MGARSHAMTTGSHQTGANSAGFPASTGVRSHADMSSHGVHVGSNSSSAGYAQQNVPAKRPKYAPETLPNKPTVQEKVNYALVCPSVCAFVRVWEYVYVCVCVCV